MKTFKLAERRKWLLDSLTTAEGIAAAPGGALYAKVLRHHIELLDRDADTVAIFRQIREALVSGEDNSNFPIDKFLHVFTELSTSFGVLKGYDELFDWMSQATERRQGEVARGRIELKRGVTLCMSRDNFAAIGHLSRARALLTKHDTIVGAARAMSALARCYSSVGLYWAARAEAVLAIGLFLRNGTDHDEAAKRLALHAATQLVWYELALGRLPIALGVWRFARALESLVERETIESAAYQQERKNEEVAFACFVLFQPAPVLAKLTRLPSFLEGVGLHSAAAALLFALGHLDKVRDVLPENPSDEGLTVFFENFYRQAAAAQLLAPAILGIEERDTATSNIFGCRIHVAYENTAVCIVVEEMILASLEVFAGAIDPLAAAATTAALSFDVSALGLDENPPKLARREGRIEVRVAESFTTWMNDPAKHAALGQWHAELVAHLAEALSFKDAEAAIAMAGERGAFSAPSVSVSAAKIFEDIVGFNRTKLDEYQGPRDDALLRSEQWWSAARLADAFKDVDVGERPSEFRHDTVTHVGIVDPAAWRASRIQGMCFMHHPAGNSPPLFGPIVNEPDEARKAFGAIRAKLGEQDVVGVLRVTFVENADRKGGYTLMIAADARRLKDDTALRPNGGHLVRALS